MLALSQLIKRNGRIKAKKFVSLVAELASVNPSFLPPKYEQTTLSALTPHHKSTGQYVVLKLLVPASVSDQPPVCLVMVDREGICVAVCVYHLGTDVPSRWSSQDVFCVLNPLLKPIELTHAHTDLSYNFLEITEPHLFVVNGRTSEQAYVHARLKTVTKTR